MDVSFSIEVYMTLIVQVFQTNSVMLNKIFATFTMDISNSISNKAADKFQDHFPISRFLPLSYSIYAKYYFAAFLRLCL